MKPIAPLLFLFFINISYGKIIKSIGLKSGITYSNIIQHSNYKISTDFKLGLTEFVDINFVKSKYLDLNVYIGYCEKGYQIKINKTTTSSPKGGLGSYKYITYINYLFFSPVLKLKMEKEKFLTYCLLGPRIDRELSNKTILDNLSYSNNNSRKTIFGITIGGGVEYKLKLFSINTEVLYFSDISKVEVGSNNFWLKNKCFAINFGATYFFNKKKE